MNNALRPVEKIDFIDLKSQYQRLKTDIDDRIAGVLNHGQYIMGPEVTELENALTDYIGVKHAIGVSDGSTALLIALMALGVGRGDEVVMPPFTFIATAEMVSLLGATPVFVDISADTYNLDSKLLEQAITAKTRAILPVGLFGQCADMQKINEVATSHKIPVIEDAAQSFGATHNGKLSCGLSTIGCTSFFPSKPFGCYGDGGACFTDDDEIATRIRQIRTHGQEKRYQHCRIGINGRLDTIQAAVLLAKFDSFPDEVAARQKAGQRYSELIAQSPVADKVTTPFVGPRSTSVYAQYTIRVPNRAAVIEQMATRSVPTAVHYPVALHKQQAYAPDSGNPCRISGELTQSLAAAESVMSLPMYPYIEESLQSYIVDVLAESVLSV